MQMEHVLDTRTGSFSSMRRVGDSSTELDLERTTKSKFASDGNEGHWLLRGKAAYAHTLSSRQMKSLIAICDAFLPSISVSGTGGDDSMETFFRTSASMTVTTQHVGYLVSKGMEHPALWQARLALWLLSSWYGTLILCGPASVSAKFPYLRSFPRLKTRTREKMLLSWSLSPFLSNNMLFKAFKFITLLTFFAQVDEKNKNPSWKALGYCVPDHPDLLSQTKQMKLGEMGGRKETGGEREEEEAIEEEEEEEERRYGPLYRVLVDMGKPRGVIFETLQKAGFPVSICRRGSGIGKGIKNPTALTIRCDAVVVGSGSGGGVVAGVLAKAGFKVVVLDKGNYFARSNLSLLEGPSAAQMYEGGGLIATDDMGVVLLAGSTVGGGSAINWSASLPTPAHVLNDWCNTYDLELFGSKAYKQALDTVCKRMGVQSHMDKEGFNNAVLRRGCLELGYPVCNIPRNSPPDHYCGWCHLGCKDGKKKGTQETWLVDLVNSGNGVILPGCNALKVLREKKGGRSVATGVVFEHDNKDGRGLKEVYVVESKVTVVACGALRTPTLLKRSGLRNANIGKQLHIHPTVMAWGYFPEMETWPEPEKKSYEGGIMTAMSTVVGNFDTSGYGAVIQTPALHPGMFSGVTPWTSGLDIKERMSRFSRTAHIFALARDRGSGKANYPKSLNYKLNENDEENLQSGLDKILRILTAAGAQEIGTHHRKGERLNVKESSSHEFERFVKRASGRRLRDLSTPIFSAHQMGSCRMGVDPKKSVVNQRGETWEVEGLFVADTSVFPTALGVNPMVTVQAIAYCTAQSIVEILSRKKPGY